jgi:hypothetical protein
MAKKYLDDSGLSYLWGKLKEIFQVKLVSGTNIKTINNNSLLGSGNITISGGGGGGDYLPLTGGTLTGDVNFADCEPTITSTASNGYYRVTREDTNTSAYFGIGSSSACGIYSVSTQSWIINKDTSGVVNVNAGVTSTTKVAGTLTVEGHNSPIGTIIEVENDTTTSVPSGTSTPLMSITLPSGVWVVRVLIRFPAMGTDRTKYVYANISGTSGATGYMYRQPCENMITEVMLTQIITAGGTYYVNVYQNSGSAKTFVAGSAAYQNVRAVRIA